MLNISQDKLIKFAQGLAEKNILRGRIGILQSDGTYTINKRSDNTVAITTENGIVYANRNGKALIGGAHVDLEWRGAQYFIRGADSTRQPDLRSVDDGVTTIRGTGNEQIVDSLLINEGLIRQQSGSLSVLVHPVTYPDVTGGLSRLTTPPPQNNVDLTSSVPGTAGQRRYTIVALDMSDGSLSAVDGSTATVALTSANLLAATLLCKQHEIPLAAVDLRNGDTAVTWDRIVDARQFAPGLTLPAKVTVTDATYTILNRDTHIFCNRAGAITLTLPSAADFQYAQDLVIVDDSGNASSNNITINRAGTDTINGGTSTTINTDYGGVRLSASSDSTWVILP